MITADKVKNQIQSLIDTANEKTGKEDVDLTSAVGSLVDGFGGGTNFLDYLTSYMNTFKNAKFPIDTEMDLFFTQIKGIDEESTVVSVQSMFQNTSGLKKVKFKTLNNGRVLNLFSVFADSVDLEIIDLSEFNYEISNLGSFVYNCKKIETILGELKFSETGTINFQAFLNCSSLKNIRFAPNCIRVNLNFPYSPLLSDASIQSIIDGLADLTGQTAKTLTVHKDVRAKIESNPQQLASIIDKNWTLASA